MGVLGGRSPPNTPYFLPHYAISQRTQKLYELVSSILFASKKTNEEKKNANQSSHPYSH